MSFLCRSTFCASPHVQLCWLCHVIQTNMLHVYHSPAHLFLSTYLFQLCIRSEGSLSCNRILSPCNFLFLMLLLLFMLHTIIRPFIFRVLGFPSHVVAPVLVLCASYILPCSNSRQLSSCCVKWHFGHPVRWLPYLWTIILLKLMPVLKPIQLSFPFRLTCCVLNLGDKHVITLIPAYIHTHLKVEPSISQRVSWFPCET